MAARNAARAKAEAAARANGRWAWLVERCKRLGRWWEGLKARKLWGIPIFGLLFSVVFSDSFWNCVGRVADTSSLVETVKGPKDPPPHREPGLVVLPGTGFIEPTGSEQVHFPLVVSNRGSARHDEQVLRIDLEPAPARVEDFTIGPEKFDHFEVGANGCKYATRSASAMFRVVGTTASIYVLNLGTVAPYENVGLKVIAKAPAVHPVGWIASVVPLAQVRRLVPEFRFVRTEEELARRAASAADSGIRFYGRLPHSICDGDGGWNRSFVPTGVVFPWP